MDLRPTFKSDGCLQTRTLKATAGTFRPITVNSGNRPDLQYPNLISEDFLLDYRWNDREMPLS